MTSLLKIRFKWQIDFCIHVIIWKIVYLNCEERYEKTIRRSNICCFVYSLVSSPSAGILGTHYGVCDQGPVSRARNRIFKSKSQEK